MITSVKCYVCHKVYSHNQIDLHLAAAHNIVGYSRFLHCR